MVYRRVELLALMLRVVVTILTVDAHLEFVALVPNGNNVGAVHALGHITWDGGGPLNLFGMAFAAAGHKWTKALCEGDADGDGQTNGQELGDPCCTWVYGNGTLPLITDVLSHPGDYGSKLNESDLERRAQLCRDAASSCGLSLRNGSVNGSSDHENGDKNASVDHVVVPVLPQPISAGSTMVASVTWMGTLVSAMIVAV